MKARELKELVDEELRQKYDDLRRELFNLKIQQSTGQLEKATRIRQLRRDIARALTVLHDRQKAK